MIKLLNCTYKFTLCVAIFTHFTLPKNYISSSFHTPYLHWSSNTILSLTSLQIEQKCWQTRNWALNWVDSNPFAVCNCTSDASFQTVRVQIWAHEAELRIYSQYCVWNFKNNFVLFRINFQFRIKINLLQYHNKILWDMNNYIINSEPYSKSLLCLTFW